MITAVFLLGIVLLWHLGDKTSHTPSHFMVSHILINVHSKLYVVTRHFSTRSNITAKLWGFGITINQHLTHSLLTTIAVQWFTRVKLKINCYMYTLLVSKGQSKSAQPELMQVCLHSWTIFKWLTRDCNVIYFTHARKHTHCKHNNNNNNNSKHTQPPFTLAILEQTLPLSFSHKHTGSSINQDEI
jgi:hypothetical protein